MTHISGHVTWKPPASALTSGPASASGGGGRRAGREGAAILIELGRVVVVSGAVGSAMIRAFGFLRQLWCERWRVTSRVVAYCVLYYSSRLVPPRVLCIIRIVFVFCINTYYVLLNPDLAA